VELSGIEVVDRLVARLYGAPLVRNDLRGELVEEIVAAALEPDWRLCGSDWASCDLIHSATGFRMEVKQSAARQTWRSSKQTVYIPRYSIASKQGRWEGDVWIAEPGRNADVFVFAWHKVLDDSCDHRDPLQWVFYAVAEPRLPSLRSISLPAIEKLGPSFTIAELKEGVAQALHQLATAA
jgi:hypothetical protein